MKFVPALPKHDNAEEIEASLSVHFYRFDVFLGGGALRQKCWGVKGAGGICGRRERTRASGADVDRCGVLDLCVSLRFGLLACWGVCDCGGYGVVGARRAVLGDDGALPVRT